MQHIGFPSRDRRQALALAAAMIGPVALGAALSLTELGGGAAALGGLALGGALLVREALPGAQSRLAGYLGKRRVFRTLADALPDSVVAITHFVVPGSRRQEIDLILVGPAGVLVLEIERGFGTVLFEQGLWWRRLGGWKLRIARNPTRQASAHQKAVVAFLLKAREQSEELGMIFVPILEPAVVFVGAHDVLGSPLGIRALPLDELLLYLDALPARLTTRQVNAVAALFRP